MPHQMTRSSERMQECIDACTQCARICWETLAYCLEKGGRHAEAEHVNTLLDCAQLCDTSAAFMERGSAVHPDVCAACAEACQRCAESCEKFGDDDQMRRCAEICRSCAESCREMAKMKAA
jgi:hypothetical protein